MLLFPLLKHVVVAAATAQRLQSNDPCPPRGLEVATAAGLQSNDPCPPRGHRANLLAPLAHQSPRRLLRASCALYSNTLKLGPGEPLSRPVGDFEYRCVSLRRRSEK